MRIFVVQSSLAKSLLRHGKTRAQGAVAQHPLHLCYAGRKPNTRQYYLCIIHHTDIPEPWEQSFIAPPAWPPFPIPFPSPLSHIPHKQQHATQQLEKWQSRLPMVHARRHRTITQQITACCSSKPVHTTKQKLSSHT